MVGVPKVKVVILFSMVKPLFGVPTSFSRWRAAKIQIKNQVRYREAPRFRDEFPKTWKMMKIAYLISTLTLGGLVYEYQLRGRRDEWPYH